MEITESEIREAVRFWRASVPAEYADLLNPKPAQNESELEDLIIAGLIVFVAGQYFNPLTGAIIPFLVVRELLETVIDLIAVSMNQTTQEMIDEKITADEWQQRIERDIVILSIIAVLLARGGLSQISNWTSTLLWIERQRKYLSAFREALPGLSPAETLARIDLYADAGRSAFEAERTEVNRQNGYTEEIRLLEAGAVHCEGCVEQANYGWMPIGTLAPIGSQQCGARCKCTKKYRRPNKVGWIETDEE